MKTSIKTALFLSLTVPLWFESGHQIACAQSIETTPAALISTKSASTMPIITKESADQDIRAIGFVDTDGSKLKAIAVHYNTDLQGADIDASTYTIHDYGMTLSKMTLPRAPILALSQRCTLMTSLKLPPVPNPTVPM